MSDKILLITGASRGIGAATARVAAERGYRVVVNYKSNRLAADEVVSHIVDRGGKAIAIQADVSVEDQVVAMFSEIDSRWGRIDALVNNAGMLHQQSRVEAMSADRINDVLATNVTGCFVCAREAVKRMSTSHGGNGGAIVNVSSMAAKLGSPHEYVDYAASKAAIDALTIGLAHEVATEGIRVNAVRPGVIYTDIHALGGEPDRIERVRHSLPLKRGGQPDEVANAILWLLSDEASYVTAGFIDVAGGR